MSPVITFFKNFFAIILLFIVAFLFLGYFMPREQQVVVTREIKCSPDVIYTHLNDLKLWKKWEPWGEYDKDMKLAYSDSTTGVGSWYTWESKKMGNGKLSIKNTELNSAVKMDLEFTERGVYDCGFNLKPCATGTSVSWYMNLKDEYTSPIANKLFGGYHYQMMKFMLGKDFNHGLDNMNKLCQ